MNRSELLKIIDESDNMELIDDCNRFRETITYQIEYAKKHGVYEQFKDHSIIDSFAEEFDGICFSRIEISGGDELTIYVLERFFRYNEELDFAAVEIGHVRNCCGFIEYFYMTQDGKFVRVINNRAVIPEEVIADDRDSFIKYLLTKEYDYHIPVTKEVYERLCEAGWYEGRRVDISEIVKSAEEHNVILTKEQKKFLEEFAGLESPDPNCRHGFCIEAKYRKYQHFYDNPRDWDDDYFDDVDKNSDEYKRVAVRIGMCSRTTLFLELSPEGLIMREGESVGRTVMEGWQILLVGHERM